MKSQHKGNRHDIRLPLREAICSRKCNTTWYIFHKCNQPFYRLNQNSYFKDKKERGIYQLIAFWGVLCLEVAAKGSRAGGGSIFTRLLLSMPLCTFLKGGLERTKQKDHSTRKMFCGSRRIVKHLLGSLTGC